MQQTNYMILVVATSALVIEIICHHLESPKLKDMLLEVISVKSKGGYIVSIV